MRWLLITSLLGLIVFPYAEVCEFDEDFLKTCTLASLTTSGWPSWQFKLGSSATLDELVRHLRNAISHRGVYFSSDSRKLEEVEIKFSDRPRGHNQPYNWQVVINAAELHRFVLNFAKFLKTKERDNS
jgi:hypothetical protein